MYENGAGLGGQVRSLRLLLADARGLLGDGLGSVSFWEERLGRLEGGEDPTIRVAVAGTVKSGKSTLVNALIGRDALKRGAGIVTSLVTRVRPGPKLRARVRLKGWGEVNRDARDAAVFLGADETGRRWDLRSSADRDELHRALEGLGDEALGDGGFFEKHAALLRGYLQGYPRMESLVREEPREWVLDEAEFERHRDFAGEDTLAAYVDDMALEIPDLAFGGSYELGDCQGYDSPNPRHKEKVQDYLLGAHVVIHVVSSRVGLREADIVFLKDLKAFGLLPLTRVVLNADLGEHGTAEDLAAARERLTAELRLVGENPSVYTFSALRALLSAERNSGQPLTRKEELLMELWSETTAPEGDEYRDFLALLQTELGQGRSARLDAARHTVVAGAAEALRTRLGAAVALAGKEAESLGGEERALRAARDLVRHSLESFEKALRAMAETLKREAFRQVDAVFQPATGELAQEVLSHAGTIAPPPEALEVSDRKKFFRQMAAIYQEMRSEFHRYKVEVVNPRSVERIRAIWATASAKLAELARAPAGLVIQSVEGYRREAESQGVSLPPLALPPLDASIGRRTIVLFSSVTYGPAESATDRVISFAGQWTRRLATGWARRIANRGQKKGFLQGLVTDAADAFRTLLAEEARANLLNSNEQVKYRVLGDGIDELAQSWAKAYRDTVDALVLDLDRLADRVRNEGSRREDLIPRLREVLHAVERLAAGEPSEPGRALEGAVR